MSQKQARRARQAARAQGQTTHRITGEPTPYFDRVNRPRNTRRTIWYERGLELYYAAQEAAEKAAAKVKKPRRTRSQKMIDEQESLDTVAASK